MWGWVSPMSAFSGGWFLLQKGKPSTSPEYGWGSLVQVVLVEFMASVPNNLQPTTYY